MNNNPGIRLVSGLMVILAVISLASTIGIGDSSNEYWGGEKGIGDNRFYRNEDIYPMGPPSYRKLLPRITDYQGWKWDPPICYELVNSSVHSWTAAEKAVARQAIEEWNQVPSPYRGRILETGTGECKGLAPDISIRWADNESFFHNWGDPNKDGLTFNAVKRVGMYVPSRTAPPFRVDPCEDLTAAGFVEGCNLVVLNWDNPSGWFVDQTPEEDEEFERETRTLCGRQRSMLQAPPGSPAYKKQDLLTVIAHEFGHALGLIHSGGCDRKPWTPKTYDLSDDDGSLMWSGPLTTRKGYLEDLYVGFSGRRHVEKKPTPSKADLVVAKITHQAESTPKQGSQFGDQGRLVKIYATISNQGAASAPSFLVQNMGSLGVSSTLVTGLAPGDSVRVKVAETRVEGKGIYMVTVSVDPTNEVDEEDEDNNTKALTLVL